MTKHAVIMAFALAIIPSLALGQEIGARYLIIAHDNFYDAALPLAQWKHKKGMRTKIVKLSAIGSSQSQIKTYIQNAYNTWTIPPEYLLLVGAPNYIPFPDYGGAYTDNYYTDMSDSLYNEILPGRLTVHTATEAQTVVNKILRYERTPEMADSEWVINACLIVREDGDYYDDSIYWSDLRQAKSLMLQNGYRIIDTLSSDLGNDASDVIASVNDGRAFVLYRGQGVGNWWSPFEVNPGSTANGGMLPIVLSITCRTIGTGSTAAGAEQWLLTGTPTLPRGGAAYFATTTVLSGGAHLRSAVSKGFFAGLFESECRTFGAACEHGRQNVYHLYGNASEYRGFNTLGDPEMNVWTAVPGRIVVTHDTMVTAGALDTVNVNVLHLGIPVALARVSLMLDTLVYLVDSTDASGNARFELTAPIPGIMDITVTGVNLYPYEGTVSVVSGDAFVTYDHCVIEDSLGNNNGAIDPGETILLDIFVKNVGQVIAPSVTAVLRIGDTLAFLSDSITHFGDIPVSATVAGINPLVLSIDPAAWGDTIGCQVVMTSAAGDTWAGNFGLVVASAGPVGPDPYGYYLYDDTDSLSGNAPVYDWFDISPSGPGTIVGEITNEDADTVTLTAPFQFTYYGNTYASIGICSNGFAEVGGSTYRFGDNTPLPAAGGPQRLLAPFWDDLNPESYGDIYQYYDADNHRWIIQFEEVSHYDNANDRETFQMVFLDPDYYTTPTGDGEVLFLYQTVADASSMTVGIEDATQTRGLEYLYNGSYDPNAAPIVAGRAVLVTTKPPAGTASPWLCLTGSEMSDSAFGNQNGMNEPGETITISIVLENQGSAGVTAAQGVMRSGSADVTVADSTSVFGDIAPGMSAGNANDPFTVTIGSNPGDTTVGLVLVVTGDGGAYETQAYLTLYIHDETGVLEWSGTAAAISGISPNPFRSELTVRFTIPGPPTTVPLTIYDACGRVVHEHMVSGVTGSGRYVWNGLDRSGRRAPAGVYFVRFGNSSDAAMHKAVMVR